MHYLGGVIYVDKKKDHYRVYLTKGDRIDKTVSFKKDCSKQFCLYSILNLLRSMDRCNDAVSTCDDKSGDGSINDERRTTMVQDRRRQR